MAMTFRVNLDVTDQISSKNPYSRGTEADNIPATRSTWFPDLILANRKLKDGDTFELSGLNAIFVRDHLCVGSFKFCDYVSGSA